METDGTASQVNTMSISWKQRRGSKHQELKQKLQGKLDFSVSASLSRLNTLQFLTNIRFSFFQDVNP